MLCGRSRSARKPSPGCFCTSPVPRVTRPGSSCQGWKPQRGPRSMPSPSQPQTGSLTASPRAATVATLSLICSQSLRFLTGSGRPTTKPPQTRSVSTAGKGVGYRLEGTENTSPGIPKLAFICPKVTSSSVKTVSGGGPERVPAAQGQGPLEVLQQAQDALLLALPELRAPAVPDVLRILWGDRGRVRHESEAWGPSWPGHIIPLSEPQLLWGVCCSNASSGTHGGSCVQTPWSCIHGPRWKGPNSPVPACIPLLAAAFLHLTHTVDAIMGRCCPRPSGSQSGDPNQQQQHHAGTC